MDVLFRSIATVAFKGIDAVFFKPGRERRKAEYLAQRFCCACNTQVGLDAAFCQNCGKREFTTRGAILENAAAEKQERKAQQQKRAALERNRKEQETRVRASRNRCRDLLSFRYCATCHVALGANHKFCETCGCATDDLPITYAAQIAHDEFPDLVSTEDEFKRFVT